MTARTLIVCSISCAVSFVVMVPGVAEALRNPLPLTRITLGTDLDAPADQDDPGTGGSFENTSYFQNKLTSAGAIAVCVDQVELSSETWAKSVGLSRSFRERRPETVTIHYARPGLPGIFAVNYVVSERISAKVRVDFYRLDGSRQSPEAAKPLLTDFRIAAFQDDLDKAMQCKSAKS